MPHLWAGGAVSYAPDRPYTPPDAGLDDFRALHKRLGVGRAVIVNASVHGTDNRVALDAIAVSGGAYRAVANLDGGITEPGLRDLHEGGFRGARFNFVRHDGDLVALIPLFAPEPELQQKILVSNPARLFELNS